MEINRIQFNQIKKYLKIAGAILVSGPKMSGKTFLSKKLCKSFYYMQEIGLRNELLINDDLEKNIILSGEKPRLIDEWQICPEIWDKIRFAIDQSNGIKGQFILTGSSTPIEKNKIIHSGTGRIIKIKMNTLTFHEVYPNDTKYSLMDFFDNKIKTLSMKSKFNTTDIIDYMLVGGWPDIHSKNMGYIKEFYENYINSIMDINTERINKLRNSSHNFRLIFNSLARNNCSQINVSTIINDTKLNIRTVEKYLEILEALDIVFFIYPWTIKNARSKTLIRTKPKIYLCDTSLGLYALNITSQQKALKDLNTLGLYFENLVIKDLKVYADAIGAKIYFYRDNNDKEVDIIMGLDDGRWGLIEIKMKNYDLDDVARKLSNFSKTLLNENKNFEDESFRMIITAGTDAYILNNNVFVIPYTLLKP